MSNRTWSLILSGTYIFGGIVILLSPNPEIGRYSLFHSDYSVDLTQVKTIVGPFFILFGLYFFIKIYKSPTPKAMIIFKCASCGDIAKLEKGGDHFCTKCKCPLEELDGFFERHPEFRDKDQRPDNGAGS